MALDDVKRQFVAKVRANNARFIEKSEEQEILEIARRQGIDPTSAAAALLQVCDTQGYVLEGRVTALIKDLVDARARDGTVGEREFNDAVAACKKACYGKRDETQCKRMVVEIIESARLKTSRGWFSSWYEKVKKEVGVK